MNPMGVIKSALICLLLAGMATCSNPAKHERPNFVFFLVDDLGWADVGFNNPGTFYETPQIDRLASEGLIFTNAYASCPVCSPTRASIMTGKYPVRTGITTYINPAGNNQPGKWKRNTPLLPPPYADKLSLSEITIAEALKESGYATFFAGKWHLGAAGYYPEDQGFDVNKGGIEKGGPYGGDKYFSPYGNPKLEDGPPGEHLPDRLATETVQFIKDHQDQPFLAYLSFYSVHTPLMARADLQKKYEQKRTMLSPETKWGKEGARKVRLSQDHAVYAGMVEAVDQAVGKVIDALKMLSLEENTIIIFTSDNGGLSTSEGHPTSNLPLRAGKGWIYEGGIREPTFIKWPGVIKPASTTEVPIISNDYYPTMLDMAGLPLRPQQHIDGISLATFLSTQAEGPERPLFWHFPHYGNQGCTPAAAIRAGNYKLIRFFENEKLELYDLRNDTGENKDLSTTEPEITEELYAQLEDWLQSTGAKLPVANPAFDPQNQVYE